MPIQFGQSNGATASGTIGEISNEVCHRSLAEAISEIEREANVRYKCFDKWVKDGKLSEVEARDRLERIISAWHFLSDSDSARAKLLEAAQK